MCATSVSETPFTWMDVNVRRRTGFVSDNNAIESRYCWNYVMDLNFDHDPQARQTAIQTLECEREEKEDDLLYTIQISRHS